MSKITQTRRVRSAADGATVGSPGCISTAVTVGSSDKQDVISYFSNMASMIDLMAPGGFGGGSCTLGGDNPDILTSIAGSSSAVTNGYACLAGTSMAAPHVAGAFERFQQRRQERRSVVPLERLALPRDPEGVVSCEEKPRAPRGSTELPPGGD